MSWITVTDPLALLAIQSGQVGNPSDQAAAAAASRLDVQQRSIAIGEPVPIVFGRWREDIGGGVFISPGATEARFANDLSNNVTASYHLVLSEGRVDDIAVKDVFQSACRVGAHTQTYDRRAGSWLPGNFIVEREDLPKPEASFFCGSVGRYPDMSTLSFEVTIPSGFDQWNRQVHLFIRGGLHVVRLLDEIEGPSDNFADLVNWMLANNGRVPSQLIDTDSLTAAAQFLEVNGFSCNVWIQESWNYSDLLAQWAPYFLLGQSSSGGKKGLRPLLPLNNDGTIATGPVSWKYVFTEDEILPNGLDIQYTTLADRMPFVVQVIWRQQFQDNAPILRTAEVRYEGTAETGPYESHDLSPFCTNETHAVKAGAYILSKRFHTSHTIRFVSRPEEHNKILTPGDIVRVRLSRVTRTSTPSFHDYLYQIERITKTMAGDVSYECSHFPVDAELRSLVALDVAAAEGTGVLFENNRTGVSCDSNSSTNGSIPEEDFIDDFDGDFDGVVDLSPPDFDDDFDGVVDLPPPDFDDDSDDDFDGSLGVGNGSFGFGSGGLGNDSDGLDNQSSDVSTGGGGWSSSGDPNNPKPDDEIEYGVSLCSDGSEPVIKAYFVDLPEGYQVGDPYNESPESWEEAFTYEGPFNEENTNFSLEVNFDPGDGGEELPSWGASLTYDGPATDPIEYNFSENDPDGKGIVITQGCPGSDGGEIIVGPTGPLFAPQAYQYWRVAGTSTWYSTATFEPVAFSLACTSGSGAVITPCGDLGTWISSFSVAVYNSAGEGNACASGTVGMRLVNKQTGSTTNIATQSVSGCNGTFATYSRTFEFSNNQSTVDASWSGAAGPAPDLPPNYQ